MPRPRLADVSTQTPLAQLDSVPEWVLFVFFFAFALGAWLLRAEHKLDRRFAVVGTALLVAAVVAGLVLGGWLAASLMLAFAVLVASGWFYVALYRPRRSASIGNSRPE